MTRELSDNRYTYFNVNHERFRLPDVQTISDKKRLIEHKKQTIAEMKSVLISELNESTYNEIYIKRITDILQEVQKDQEQEQLDTMLRRLVKSTRISKRANRVAQIILDEQDGIERAKEAIAIFKASVNKSSAALARMRSTQEMLKTTGKQNPGK